MAKITVAEPVLTAIKMVKFAAELVVIVLWVRLWILGIGL
jgi:hypothetical protein